MIVQWSSKWSMFEQGSLNQDNKSIHPTQLLELPIGIRLEKLKMSSQKQTSQPIKSTLSQKHSNTLMQVNPTKSWLMLLDRKLFLEEPEASME